MTNKRKIAILKKAIRKLREIIKSDDYCNQDGICDIIGFKCMNDKEMRVFLDDERDSNPFMVQEFKIRMPEPINHFGYCWEHTKEGYQARIKACEKAIERLSK